MDGLFLRFNRLCFSKQKLVWLEPLSQRKEENTQLLEIPSVFQSSVLSQAQGLG